jgi:hypothetical protein
LRNFTHLRLLEVDAGGEYPLKDLAANPSLGQLTHLVLTPPLRYRHDEGAYITLAGVRALVCSKHLGALTHLTLSRSDLGDEGCREIVASGILKRLKVLDVHAGSVTDEGARVLAGCPDLRNLELLNVSENRLSRAGIQALKATGIKVEVVAQQLPDSEGEYHDSYLYDEDLCDEFDYE